MKILRPQRELRRRKWRKSKFLDKKYCLILNFRNYLVVTSVDREPGCLRLTAILVGDSESPERVIFLKDNWSSVEVKVNNLVCVINPRGAFSKVRINFIIIINI